MTLAADNVFFGPYGITGAGLWLVIGLPVLVLCVVSYAVHAIYQRGRVAVGLERSDGPRPIATRYSLTARAGKAVVGVEFHQARGTFHLSVEDGQFLLWRGHVEREFSFEEVLEARQKSTSWSHFVVWRLADGTEWKLVTSLNNAKRFAAIVGRLMDAYENNLDEASFVDRMDQREQVAIETKSERHGWIWLHGRGNPFLSLSTYGFFVGSNGKVLGSGGGVVNLPSGIEMYPATVRYSSIGDVTSYDVLPQEFKVPAEFGAKNTEGIVIETGQSATPRLIVYRKGDVPLKLWKYQLLENLAVVRSHGPKTSRSGR